MRTIANWLPPVPTTSDDFGTSTLHVEERANQITHGVGFVWSLFAGAWLLSIASAAPDWRIVVGCAVYVAALVVLYLASTLSHSFTEGVWRDRFRLFDQVCIFLMIAGSVTPIALAYWPTWMLATLLVGVWVLALVGIGHKLLVHGPNKVSLGIYVALGWLPAMGIWPVISQMPLVGGTALVAGGLCYTAGTYFWLMEGRLPYSHAIWHLFVFAGSVAHWCVIRYFVAENSPLLTALGS